MLPLTTPTTRTAATAAKTSPTGRWTAFAPTTATRRSASGTSSTTSTACSTTPYRERYQANLKRDLPRIPFAPDFRAFAEAGARLATIHVGYEEQPEYRLRQAETPDMPLDWRVEKMRLSKDKRSCATIIS